MKIVISQLTLIVILSSGLGNHLGAQTPDSNKSQRGIGISNNSTTIQEGGNQVEFADGGKVKIDTQNPDFDRGMEFLFADKMPQAIEFLGRSLKSDPTNPQAHINLAEAYFHLENYEQVIEECNKAIELSKAGWVYRTRRSIKAGTADPLVKGDLASAFAKRGIANWELKQKPAAVADFNEAVRFGTTDSTVYIYRGQFYLNEGSLDRASQDFSAAIKIAPKSALSHGLRALVELKQGNDALAAADSNRADQIDPAVRKQLESVADGILAARTAAGQTQDEIVKQSSGAIAEWVLGEVEPKSDEAIEWLTDMQQGYDQSDSKNLPLVILVTRENEDGPLPGFRELEEGTFSTREFNLFRQRAVFVRINVAANDLSASTQEFVGNTVIGEVPLLIFMEGSRISFAAISGTKPTEEYIRQVRRKLIQMNLAKLSRDKAKCTDAEFMRGVETYSFDTDALKTKEDDAIAKRRELLNNLRDNGQFQITEFLVTEKALDEIQSKLRDRLLVLAELNSPVISEYCSALLEFDSIFRDSDYLLRRDLIGVTVNGQFLEESAINIAKKVLDQSRKDLKAEDDAVEERVNESVKALEDRFDQVLQQDEPQADKSK